MRILLIGLFCLCYAESANASDHRINDYLLGLSPAGQVQYITQHTPQDANVTCHGYGAVYQGVERTLAYHPVALWSLHCAEGKSYHVKIAVDGKEDFMDCRVYEHRYHGTCFRQSSDQ